MSAKRFTRSSRKKPFGKSSTAAVPYRKSLRVGVSGHSLYQWVKSVALDKSEKQASELPEAMGEFLTLRGRCAARKEARDMLKKAARYFAKKSRVLICAFD
jgi:transposase